MGKARPSGWVTSGWVAAIEVVGCLTLLFFVSTLATLVWLGFFVFALGPFAAYFDRLRS